MPKRRASSRRQPRRAKALPARPSQTPFERELTTKRRGEISELAFALAAARHGFAVSKPFQSQAYDVIVDPLVPAVDGSRPRLVRVQVKSSTTMRDGLYNVVLLHNANGRWAAYTPSDVDLIVVHVIPEDSWFIFPLAHIEGKTGIMVAPKNHRYQHGYDSYREAWHYFTDPDGIKIV